MEKIINSFCILFLFIFSYFFLVLKCIYIFSIKNYIKFKHFIFKILFFLFRNNTKIKKLKIIPIQKKLIIKRIKNGLLNFALFPEEIIRELKFLKNSSLQKKIPKKNKKIKIAYIKASFGKYDHILEPASINENYDYYAFTDNLNFKSNVFRPFFIPISDSNPTKAARFVKFNLNIFFPSYDILIWSDANIREIKSINSLVDYFIKSKNDLALFKHPHRSDILNEIEKCFELNKITSEEYKTLILNNKHLDKIENLVETGFMLIKNSSVNLRNAMTDTFNTMALLNIFRDQVFFPQNISKNKISCLYINKKNSLLSVRDYGNWRLVPHQLTYIENFYSNNKLTQEIKFPYLNLPEINKSINIILPIFNAEKYVIKCIDTIVPQLGKNISLRIMDDCSDNLISNKISNYVKKNKNISYYRNVSNLGYVKNVNRAIKKYSNSDSVFIINSDTQFPNNFFKNLNTLLFSNNKIGAVSALGSNAGIFSFTKKEFNSLKAKLDGNFYNYCFVNDLHGSCYGIKTDVLNEIGYLDESFFPNGYGEENDLYIRLQKYNYLVALSLDNYYKHYGNKSFGKIKRQINKKNARLSLKKKYPIDIDSFYSNSRLSKQMLNKYVNYIIKN